MGFEGADTDADAESGAEEEEELEEVEMRDSGMSVGGIHCPKRSIPRSERPPTRERLKPRRFRTWRQSSS